MTELLEETPHSQLDLAPYYPALMRVLLQNTETKLYFISGKEWTDDPAKAMDFEEVENAAQAYHTQDLVYARIVVDSAVPSHSSGTLVELLRQARPRA
jgi:hypothetical protein